ncbi:ABC transporter ATP-binding protein [Larsenimonas rhizosphaerae]|uniref:ABC transporter ATP-binding protein n=1 Tax=Larsenimonas rhizosphaerae TaxID=2944682 RepID=UPI0020332A52|nr:ATP-binding cassette domain-containing protein [Larsenimonas rhizosphaerae]MCM2131398.1 ATP-binding cassette domain-containing protein [Larsenimonas rhizosphaerae]
MTPLMEVRNLCVETTQPPIHTLLHPVSFTLHAGRPLTLLGETGSGKSLLAQAVMGTLPPGLRARGDVMVEGRNFLALPARARAKWWGRHFALLPQEPWHALDPTMRIGAQIEEGHRLVAGRSRSAAQHATDQSLMRLGLADCRRHLPQALSGGMAQRAAFAAARTTEAPIVIADEPTKGLDSTRRDEVVTLLREALNERSSLLAITHDIDVARQLGGDIMVVRDGICLEQGEARTVLDAPRSEYAKRLIAADPRHWPAPASPAPASAQPVIEGRTLRMKRGNRVLFSNLSLTLSPGEIVGLTGPSGCGKSTLGDILLGIITPDEGHVHRARGHAPLRFQKLYQDPPAAFAPHWTLHTLLEDLCARHRLDRGRIPLLMTRLGLHARLLQRQPGQLSGGELQRFSILRALLLEPVFLFADEPTSRLDPITQQDTLALLTDVAREHDCAVLLVSHDPALITASCDRQVVLSG